MVSQKTLLVIASLLGVSFSIIRLFEQSKILALRELVQPIAPYVLGILAAAVFLFVVGSLGRVKLAIIISILVVIGFMVVS